MESKILLDRQFNSFEELADITSGWDVDFRQLNNENYKPSIFQAQSNLLLISCARFGCIVDQKGATPPGMQTFALPNNNCSEFYWFGHKVEQNSLLLFPLVGDIVAMTRAGFDVTTFSIPVSYLHARFENAGIDNEKYLSNTHKIKKLPSELSIRIRQILGGIIKILKNKNLYKQAETQLNILQEQLTDILIKILVYTPNKLLTQHRKKAEQLGMVTRYINANIYNNITNRELYEHIGVSARTLQNLFKQELGILPKSYISSQKLYLVHRKLWNNTDKKKKISEIANEFGFWHMGQFASDYYEQFGELPSDTLKRPK